MTTLDPPCAQARQTIEALGTQLKTDEMLQLAISGAIAMEPKLFSDTALNDAAAHCEHCADCQHWAASLLDTLHPERIAKRERLNKYCCVSMFAAVNDASEAIRFSFERFRNEDPCWLINGEYVFARFCPWCSTRLPDQAFESDSPEAPIGHT